MGRDGVSLSRDRTLDPLMVPIDGQLTLLL